jgi:hypothetical protein
MGCERLHLFSARRVCVDCLAVFQSRLCAASRLLSGESGTGFQPVICDSHSQDGCANLGSTGGARLSQASILGDFQRSVSSQMILK